MSEGLDKIKAQHERDSSTFLNRLTHDLSDSINDSTPDSCHWVLLRGAILQVLKWSLIFTGTSNATLALGHETQGIECLLWMRSSMIEHSSERLEALTNPSERQTKRSRTKVKESSSFGNLCPPANCFTPEPAPKSAALLPTMCWMARVSACPTRWRLDDALIAPTSP